MKRLICISVLFFTSLFSGLSAAETSYTLYRNSIVLENTRYHVATFDSTDGHDYNETNCWIAADLFQNQQYVKTRFWCEKGKFKK